MAEPFDGPVCRDCGAPIPHLRGGAQYACPATGYRARLEALSHCVAAEHRAAFFDLVAEGKLSPGFRDYLDGDEGARRATDEALELLSASFEAVATTLSGRTHSKREAPNG